MFEYWFLQNYTMICIDTIFTPEYGIDKAQGPDSQKDTINFILKLL